jgi:hypothetical protein
MFWVMSALLAIEEQQAHCDDGKPITLTTIMSAWKAREREVIAFDFHAVGTEFRPKTTFPAEKLALAGERPREKERSVPDTSFRLGLRLAVDRNLRARFDYDGKGLVPDENGSYPDMRSNTVWKDGVQTLFFPFSGLGYPSGHVSKDSNCLAARSPQTLPLMMVYRPLDEKIGVFDANKLRLKDSKSDAETEIVLTHGESMLWVDRTKDFVPTRYRLVSRGVTSRSIDITYASDVRFGWVPKSWKQVTSPNGVISDSCTVDVVDSILGDGAVSDDTFVVTFPPGTWVRDYIRDESWIVREDGSQRTVLKSEDGLDYNELITTKTGVSKGPILWIGALVCLTVVIMTLWYWRWRHRRSSPIAIE